MPTNSTGRTTRAAGASAKSDSDKPVPIDELAARLPGAVILHARPVKGNTWMVTKVRTRPTGDTIVRNGQAETEDVEVSLS